MPRPMFENCGKPLAEDEIAAVEAELHLTLPEQYRRFLLQTNGGQPNPDVVGDIPVNNFCSVGESGVADLIYHATMNWEVGLSADLLAIGHGMCGHTICLGVRGSSLGKVYVYDDEFGTLKLYANDFDTFLEGFYEPDFSDLDDGDSDDDGDDNDYDNEAER